MPDTISLFLMGLIYGATTCTISCLPYLGPYLLCTGSGFKDGVTSTLIFLTAKLISYVALGGIAASLGHALSVNDVIPVKTIMGFTLIAVGICIPFIKKRKRCHNRNPVTGKGVSLFALGVSTSLLPCPPLMAMFLLSAKEGDIFTGVYYGLIYGLGLILSPLLLVGGGISLISERLKQEVRGFIPFMQGASVIIILIMGIRIIIQEA